MSLKGKTDQELLDLVRGLHSSLDGEPCETDSERKPSPLDRLWEMDPRDAAVAFAMDHISDSMKGMQLKIDDRNAQPPKSGEIGLRWISGNYYAPPEQGATILKYDGYNSELLVSQVIINGRTSKQELEAAVMKTDSHPLRRLVAQQTFEILWWLRHIRIEEGSRPNTWSSGTMTSVDDFGRFWMKPGGPVIEKARFGEPCGQCLVDKEPTSYDAFADTLIRRLMYRSGIKERYPKPTIGTHVDPDEDAKFLHNRPPQDDPEKLKQWIGKLTSILQDPKRHYLYSQVMDVLVPTSDPLRYDDRRIDDALLDVLHRGLEATATLKRVEAEKDRMAAEAESELENLDPIKPGEIAKLKKLLEDRKAKREQERVEHRRLSDLRFNAFEAAAKLGFHDATVAFRELFQLAKQPGPDIGDDRPLIAVASLAARHPELRQELATYLGEKLSDPAEQTARGTPTIEAIWRADLRELSSKLEQTAALSRPAPSSNDSRETTIEKASLVLIAWRETDLLTKAKLNALLTGRIGGGNTIPEVLRRGFAELSPEDQFAFRQFITWMRTVDVGFSRRYLENTFTPHTPRPDIQFEL